MLLPVAFVFHKAVESVVTQTLATDKSAKRNGVKFTGEDAILVDATHVDLNRGVILRSDETVGGRAGEGTQGKRRKTLRGRLTSSRQKLE